MLQIHSMSSKSNFRPEKALFAFWRLRRLESEDFHGLQNMVAASSIWSFWGHYNRKSKFIHSLEASPFQIFYEKLHFWRKKFKMWKSCSFLEGFLHKIILKTKQIKLKKSKFSSSVKSHQIHSVSRKLVPKQSAILREWLGAYFDHLHVFKWKI